MTRGASKLDSAGTGSRTHAPLHLVCAAAESDRISDLGGYVFGEIHFGARASALAAPSAGAIEVHVPVTQLGGSAITEYWLSPSPVEHGRLGEIRYGVNEQVLFAYTAFEFSRSGAVLEQRTRRQYEAMLGFLRSQGYPYLLRVWNYLPHIAQPLQGMDCYRRFCRARYQAFEAFFDDLVPQLPATSVLGTRGGELQTLFLAAKSRPTHYENPRQVSAYRYPREYGPRSPLFARATLARWGARDTLFVSGTASIVGHESRHIGDAAAQTAEILRNLDALTAEVSQTTRIPLQGLDRAPCLRVYLRNPRDLSPIRGRIEARMAPDAQIVYLQADICRPELLVEMEALIDLEPSN